MLVGEFRAILAQVAGRIGLALEAHLTFEVGIPGEPIRIVDIGASLISMGALILFLKVWQPKQLWLSPALRGHDQSASTMATTKPLDKTPLTQSEVFSALLPWIIVCIVIVGLIGFGIRRRYSMRLFWQKFASR